MSEMLDRIAEAMTTYYWSKCGEDDFVIFRNDARGDHELSAHFTEAEAEQACKRINARAVLNVIRHPGADTLIAGAAAIPDDRPSTDAPFGTATWALDSWQAMIDHMLIEAKEGE